MRLIDLSVPLQHMAASEPMPASIHYVTHEHEGLAQMQSAFGITTEDLTLPAPASGSRFRRAQRPD